MLPSKPPSPIKKLAVTLPVVRLPAVILPTADIRPVEFRTPAVTLPATDRLVRVPREVTDGWAAVTSWPLMVPAPIAVTARLPTVRLGRVPTAVILGWLAVWMVPLTRLAVSVAAVTVPVQLTDVRMPTDVILGWLAAVTVPAATARGGTKFSRYWKFSSSSFSGIEPDCVPKV